MTDKGGVRGGGVTGDGATSVGVISSGVVTGCGVMSGSWSDEKVSATGGVVAKLGS